MVEIIEQIYLEIKNYGHEESKKKLIAGIVLTGGGAQLKHIKQLVEYITGMDTRIGYPNEHLASNSDSELSSPLYATVVGLLMKGLKENEKRERVKRQMEDKSLKTSTQESVRPKKTIFEKWGEKFRDFLDNAE